MGKDKTFEGITIYVGIDVHLKSWSIAPFTDYTALKKFTLSPPSPEKLVRTLQSQYPGASFKCCYEAGYSGFWIQRELEQLGATTIVANAADIPTSDKDSRRKTDSRDASKIARELRSGNINAIYVPGKKHEAARSIVRYRHTLVKDARCVKQRIKMYLHNTGSELGSSLKWSKKGLEELESSAKAEKDEYLLFSLRQLRDLESAKRRVTLRIKQISKQEPYCAISGLLQTVPGVSMLGSMILITELIDIKRFRNTDKLCSYLGLVPDTNDSGERSRNSGITARSNKRLRTFLIECSWVAVRIDPALARAYANYRKHMPGNKAIVKVARKLASRVRHVWQHQEPYQMGLA
jgi:transposase